jgi:hypothetical protein
MIEELQNELLNLPEYLKDYNHWHSLLIDKFPPVIYRLSYKISETRTLLLHKLHNCKGDHALMHSHSWPFACLVVNGGYEMGIGYSQTRDIIPTATFTTFVKPGDIYQMLDCNMYHYTKPLNDTEASYSILLIGERTRARQALNNDPLNQIQQKEVFDYFMQYLNKSC